VPKPLLKPVDIMTLIGCGRHVMNLKSIAGRGALKEGKGSEPHIPSQSPAGFVLNKLQIEIRALRPISKVLTVFKAY
jgi:hypothetical protein